MIDALALAGFDLMGQWGRLNSGQTYGILAEDVDRALALAGLTSYEAIIVQQVREQSWGTATRNKIRGGQWPDPKPCSLNLSDLAKRLGVPFQRLYEARIRLEKARILIALGDGLTINKEADQWLDPKGQKPRLTDTLIAFATDGRSARAFTEKRECKPPVHSRKNVNAEPSAFTEKRECAFTESREEHSRKNVNADSRDIIEERARVLRETKKITEEKSTTIRPCPSDDESEWIQPGRYEHPREDVERLWRLAVTAFPGTVLPEQINEHRRWRPVDCWAAAIKEARRVADATRNGGLAPGQRPFDPTGRHAWRYIDTIAATYEANGIPVEAPSDGRPGRPAPKPTPEPSYYQYAPPPRRRNPRRGQQQEQKP